MKRVLLFVICTMIILTLCACNDNSDDALVNPDASSAATVDQTHSELSIIGTWVCEDISEDCYFIFDENGDAFAKWGTSTVYGYFDYYEEDDIYDIDVPNFLYNEYKAHFGSEVMTLKSDESSFTFKKATMPEIVIKGPDHYAIDDGLIGNWQSADSYECYEFKGDGTAIITDILNYATIDCKFSCDKGSVTFYYMASKDKPGNRTSTYSFTDDGKLVLGDYTYEKVQ